MSGSARLIELITICCRSSFTSTATSSPSPSPNRLSASLGIATTMLSPVRKILRTINRPLLSLHCKYARVGTDAGREIRSNSFLKSNHGWARIERIATDDLHIKKFVLIRCIHVHPCSIQIVLPLMSRVSGLTDGVQSPLAGLSPTATAPSGRHPYRRPRSWGLAATIVSRPTRRRPRAETGPRMAADAELASGRVGQDDFRARSPFGKRGERER
jgi:hypothetical protein